MKDVLEPLTVIAGLRLAALVSADGVPIALASGMQQMRAPEEQAEDPFDDFHAFAAIATGWMNDVQRAVGPLSWSVPRRVVLSASRGALVMCQGPGAVLLVVLEHGVSPEDLQVPMDGAIARMQRKLRSMGTTQDLAGPTSSGPDRTDHPSGLFPTREESPEVPSSSPTSPSHR